MTPKYNVGDEVVVEIRGVVKEVKLDEEAGDVSDKIRYTISSDGDGAAMYVKESCISLQKNKEEV